MSDSLSRTDNRGIDINIFYTLEIEACRLWNCLLEGILVSTHINVFWRKIHFWRFKKCQIRRSEFVACPLLPVLTPSIQTDRQD